MRFVKDLQNLNDLYFDISLFDFDRLGFGDLLFILFINQWIACFIMSVVRHPLFDCIDVVPGLPAGPMSIR